MENAFSFIVETRALLRAVRCIKRYISAREKASARKSLWLSVVAGRLNIELDAEARIAKMLTVEALYEATPHPIAVPADVFAKVLSRCPAKIQIFFDGSELKILTPDIRLVLPFIGPEWYCHESAPIVPSSADGLSKIVAAVSEVLHSASKDPEMEALNCVHFSLVPGMLHVEALNGHMYQRVSIALDASTSAAAFALNGVRLPLSHAKCLAEAFRSGFLGEGLGVSVLKRGAVPRLVVVGQEGVISLPLYCGKYPNTLPFMERRKTATGRITVAAKDVVSVLGMMLPTLSEYNKIASFKALPDSLCISSRSECGMNSAYIFYFDAEGVIPFPFAVPAEALLALIARVSSSSDDLLFEFTGSEGPCFISASSKPESLSIIMPMKVMDNYDMPDAAPMPEPAGVPCAEVA